MNHDKSPHDDQMTRLLERAMVTVTASDELVAGGLSRGRRATRRRRTAQAVGIGAAAALTTVAAIAAPSFLGGQDDQGSSASNAADVGSDTAGERTREPGSPSTSDELPPHLQRAQELLLDAFPEQIPDPGYMTRVDYDPDGRGSGEILALVTTDGSGIVDQHARCDRVSASPAPDDCVDTGTGWVFTGPSVPDVSGTHPGLAGVQVNYLLRDGRTISLTAYNAVKANLGGEPTRTDPVLDTDELVELVTELERFS